MRLAAESGSGAEVCLSDMNRPTKNQHYIWRSYLAAWTKNDSPNGQIMCLRDKKLFPVSLMKIAQENCFYKAMEVSQKERDLVFKMTVEYTKGVQRITNESWLNLYCAPFDFADEQASFFTSILEIDNGSSLKEKQEFINWTIEYVEKIHAQIESMGMPYISALRQNKLDFWEDDESRDKFCFFLCNQYFRTKKTRDGIVFALEKGKSISSYFEDIRPENMWIPISLVFASNAGAHISQKYSAVLLQSNGTQFIVGDQPVVNTFSTFDMMTAPADVEFFYPVTPYSAVLVTANPEYTSGEIVNVSSDEVKKYNELEFRTSNEMVFAKESAILNSFL